MKRNSSWALVRERDGLDIVPIHIHIAGAPVSSPIDLKMGFQCLENGTSSKRRTAIATAGMD